MPQLPVYTSQRNINSQQVEPFRNEAEQPYIDRQKALSAIGDVAQKWSDAQDVMQATKAKSDYESRTLDIQSRASLDPDFNNSDKYIKELDKAKSDSISSVNNISVRNKLSMDFDHSNRVSAIKIQTDANKKQIEVNKVNLRVSIDSLQKKKLSAGTDIEKNKYDNDINVLINANIATGTISYDEADKLIKSSQKTGVQYEIYSDPSTKESESNVLKELQNPNGKYSYLDQDTRLDLIQESQRRIFQNNQTFKKEVDISQNQRNTDMIEKMATQEVTFKDIDREFAIPEESGGIKRSILLNYQKYIQRGVDKTLNDMMKEKVDGDLTKRANMVKQYNDLIEMYLDDKSDQWKAKETLSKAFADGVIDSREQQILYPLKDNLKDIQFNRDKSPISWAIKEIKKFMNSSNASDEDIAYRTKQLLNGIGEGKDPQSEMKSIMDSEMLKHFPDYKTYDNKGRLKVDRKSGRTYRVYPDGTWNWEVKGNSNE